ncbi:MAG: DUF5615 family PIN-like protein [Candidatus Dormibacteria bacterium]
MRLKLDENLPRRAEELLSTAGHDVDTVPQEGLAGQPDSVVAAAATAADRLIVTLDRDFSDIGVYPPGSSPGIIVIRLQEPRPSLVVVALSMLLARHSLDELAGCTVIVQLGGIRIRRPVS